jgi:hypothetical protein
MDRIIRHEPLKMRHEYERRYDSKGRTLDVTVSRKDIEELIDIKEVWRTSKWLTEQTEHGCARLDFTVYCLATKIAKRVLLGEELKQVEEESVGLFKKKSRELLSNGTMEQIRKYVFKSWKLYEKFNMLTFTKVKYTKTFGLGRRRRSYTYRETAIKLTEKGRGVVV